MFINCFWKLFAQEIFFPSQFVYSLFLRVNPVAECGLPLMAALFDVGSGSICGSAGPSYIFAFLVRESEKKEVK
jgi:hypothetical protein